MNPKTLIEMLAVAERLKDTMRHCYTKEGRRESVAEHSWRLALMAYWIKDEIPGIDVDKVIKMCLIHDLGESFTGDIPVFLKTDADSKKEDELLNSWVDTLPEKIGAEMRELYAEMDARETLEAKVYKALDGLEALIAHNESDLSTWEPNEYELQMVYAFDRVQFDPFLKSLREQIKEDTVEKIKEGNTIKEND